MCNVFYLTAIGLLLVYTDYVIGQYSLAVSAGQEAPIIVAVGWEMVPTLWPVAVLGMVIGSAVTLLFTRRRRNCTASGCAGADGN